MRENAPKIGCPASYARSVDGLIGINILAITFWDTDDERNSRTAKCGRWGIERRQLTAIDSTGDGCYIPRNNNECDVFRGVSIHKRHGA